MRGLTREYNNLMFSIPLGIVCFEHSTLNFDYVIPAQPFSLHTIFILITCILLEQSVKLQIVVISHRNWQKGLCGNDVIKRQTH